MSAPRRWDGAASVRVSWRVHFEFTITRDPILALHDSGEKLADALNVQALSLDHPVFVHSCNPINVGMAVLSAPSHALIKV